MLKTTATVAKVISCIHASTIKTGYDLREGIWNLRAHKQEYPNSWREEQKARND